MTGWTCVWAGVWCRRLGRTVHDKTPQIYLLQLLPPPPTECPRDTYRAGPSVCLPCPRNSRTAGAASALSECACVDGYRADDNGDCVGERMRIVLKDTHDFGKFLFDGIFFPKS